MSVMEQRRPVADPRKAKEFEARDIAETLAAAFFDDPVIGWAWNQASRRHEILADFFELMVMESLAYNETYTTDDFAGAALWLPPAAQKVPDEQVAAFAGAVERVTAEFAPSVLELFSFLEDHHPHEPHFYLPIIGTRPEKQGCGIGSALLDPVLSHCDQEKLPAYLEATTRRNQALYVRRGFQVMEEIPLPNGPLLWAMWREPRSDLADPLGVPDGRS